MAEYLPLGTPVTVSAIMERKSYFVADGVRWNRTEKSWRRVERQTSGVVVGVRTLSSGVTVYLGAAAGVEWKPSSWHRVYAVAVSLYRKPLFVPLDAATATEPITEGEEANTNACGT